MGRQLLPLKEFFDRVEEGESSLDDLLDRETPLVPAGDIARVTEKPQELIPTRGDTAVRQAGADLVDTVFINEVRREAERNLYVFAKAVLGKWWLYPPLHVPVCRWLTDLRRHRRKLLLLPRSHGKTTIICDTLPLHLLIQPKESNIYMPGVDGAHSRILMACETQHGAERHVQVLEAALESNRLLRALWPSRVWPGRPAKYTKTWNKQAFTIPRDLTFPEPSVMGCGVGAAITGAHPNCLIKDDLIGFPRCLSLTEMEVTREWHETSRNLMRGQPHHLEYVIGTHWTPQDIYVHMRQDPSMDVMVRSAIEDGQVIYPEQGSTEDGSRIGFTLEDLRAEERRNPVLFQLNYMNSPAARGIVDFPRSSLRFLTWHGGVIRFEEDERDVRLREEAQPSTPLADELSRLIAGTPFTPQVQAAFFSSIGGGTGVRFL